MTDRLAIEGGKPARARPDVVRTPLIGTALYGEPEIAAATEVLRERVLWRYHGARTAEFERLLAERFADSRGRALAVNSGTSALYLAFAALGLPEGSPIAMPTVGFVAVAAAAAAAGLVPRFVPVDRGLGMDVSELGSLPGVPAVLAVHPYGAPCDVGAVAACAARAGAVLVEDVAQCLGGTFGGRKLGMFGVASAFSLQYFKLLSTGEGGFLFSRDPELIDRAETMHDAAADWTVPEVAGRVPSVARPPLNLRMSELEAAIGTVQLGRVDGTIDRMRTEQRRVLAAAAEFDDVLPRPVADPAGDVGSSVILHLPTRAEAEWTCRALAAEGVRAGMLLGAPGSNRHWAGDWGPTLRRAGIPEPTPSVVERDRELLGGAIHLPADITHDDEDITQTCDAIGKVLRSRAAVRS